MKKNIQTKYKKDILLNTDNLSHTYSVSLNQEEWPNSEILIGLEIAFPDNQKEVSSLEITNFFIK